MEPGVDAGGPPAGDAGSLRLLKALVFALTVVMIVGFIVLIAFLVTRFPAGPGPAVPALPDAVALPAGERPAAFTAAGAWYAVVTESGRILVYGRDGALLKEIAVEGGD